MIHFNKIVAYILDINATSKGAAVKVKKVRPKNARTWTWT